MKVIKKYNLKHPDLIIPPMKELEQTQQKVIIEKGKCYDSMH